MKMDIKSSLEDKGSGKPGERAKELLLVDYKNLADSFWKNEETGERRVKFLITLVTAVLGALATLLAKKDGLFSNEAVYMIAIYALFALLVVGIVTLFRIIKRNEVTDGYKKDMEDIRGRFKESFDELNILKDYAPFRGLSGQKPPLRKFGGLAHTVAVINSLIVGVLAAVLLSRIVCLTGITALTVAAAVGFCLSFFVEVAYIRIAEKGSKDAMERK